MLMIHRHLHINSLNCLYKVSKKGLLTISGINGPYFANVKQGYSMRYLLCDLHGLTGKQCANK